MTSRYRYRISTKQPTLRLPEAPHRRVEAVARVEGTGLNQMIVAAIEQHTAHACDTDEFRTQPLAVLDRDIAVPNEALNVPPGGSAA